MQHNPPPAMPAYRAHLTPKSANAKTGPIPTSVTERVTCAASCPLDRNGCYADAGFHTRLHWDKVSAGERGVEWTEFCRQVAELPDGSLWRHNVAGDLPGIGDFVAPAALEQLVRANDGKRGFTYTHKPPTGANLDAIRSANAAGFTINASADDMAEADAFLALELPVVVVLPADAPKVSSTPKGARVVVCPAQTNDRTTCATCGLCQRRDRSFIIGFRAHGNQAAKINTGSAQ